MKDVWFRASLHDVWHAMIGADSTQHGAGGVGAGLSAHFQRVRTQKGEPESSPGRPDSWSWPP